MQTINALVRPGYKSIKPDQIVRGHRDAHRLSKNLTKIEFLHLIVKSINLHNFVPKFHFYHQQRLGTLKLVLELLLYGLHLLGLKNDQNR